MHKFHKRQDFLTEILPLHFREFPNTPQIYILKQELILMKERANSIYVRVTDKEKLRIKNKADKCGITISEYLRKRALGYSPKALLPECFYEFSGKLSDLYEQINKGCSTELEEKILSLIDEIQLKLLTPERKEVDE